ncbi:MAG: hypothetical protein MRY78_14210 [Saprospiraceae bacterium]|nr:hypothetical protein [Saprospiraceae bacterium]
MITRITPILLLLFSVHLAFSQTDSTKKREVARSIFYAAQEGHRDFDSRPLLEAVELLLEHPYLQSVEADTISPVDTIPKAREFNYFDIHELFKYAKKYAPFDDPALQKKIKETDQRMPLQGMGPNDLETAKIENGNYLVPPQKTRKITKSFSQKGLVNLTIEYGGDIKLSVKSGSGNELVGQEKSNEVVKFLDFIVSKPGSFTIIIENQSDEEKDCFLTIESR